jgi:hypothetical protein
VNAAILIHCTNYFTTEHSIWVTCLWCSDPVFFILHCALVFLQEMHSCCVTAACQMSCVDISSNFAVIIYLLLCWDALPLNRCICNSQESFLKLCGLRIHASSSSSSSSSSGTILCLFESLGLLNYFSRFNSFMYAFCPVIYFQSP